MNTIINKSFEQLFGGLTSTSEYEVSFSKNTNLNLNNFINIINYLKYKEINEKLKLEITYDLDISYNYNTKDTSVYRITVSNIKDINNIINNIDNHNNTYIYKILLLKILKNDKNINIIEKIKNKKKYYDLDNYNLRFRLAEEKDIAKDILNKLLDVENIDENISFRYKQRLSLILEDNKDYKISIDCTQVKMSKSITYLLNQNDSYELEIDLTVKNLKNTMSGEKKIKNIFTDNIINLIKVINSSYYIISKTEKEEVEKNYKKLLDTKNFYSMNVVSLETNNIVDDLIINYSVTDKADGESSQLFIFNNKVYLVSRNFEIQYTNIDIKDKSYNNTILDGELIYLKNKTYLYTSFDILYYKGKDTRKENLLTKRLELLDDIIINILNKDFKISKYKGEYTIDNILKHYDKSLNIYLTDINKLTNNGNKYNFTRKYYMISFGLSNNEIFKYSSLMWNKYKEGMLNIWEYELDGMVYTPLNQIYTANISEQKYKIYKWKPPELNSIDFYIKFKREKNKIINAFDNSVEDSIHDKVYRICELYVGQSYNNVEVPVYFKRYLGLHECKLYVNKNNVVIDIDNKLIQDNTIVEFYYDKNIKDEKNRWIPIRTRYDKTQYMLKNKARYGNYKTVADGIWNSIQENNTIEVINNLSNNSLYEKTLLGLKSKIDVHQLTKQKATTKGYYTKITKIGESFRAFNNFIKDNLILSYCSKKIVNGKEVKMNVLDLGIGVGGDLMKMYHAKIGFLLGIDYDYYGIYSAANGAISRYTNNRKKYPGHPKMDFSQASASIELNMEDQAQQFKNITVDNKKTLEKYFGKSKDELSNYKFDVFNCQFVIHYMFEKEDYVLNYCKNIVNYLNKDGYLIITTSIGTKLHELFKKGDGIIESYYTTENGKKELFFRYTAQYDYKNDNIKQYGLAYTAYLSWINHENETYTEYIVNEELLKDTLIKNGNMTLVEEDSFYNIYEDNKDFFINSTKYESDKRTIKSIFNPAKGLYKDENKFQQIFAFLSKYYIFKKN